MVCLNYTNQNLQYLTVMQKSPKKIGDFPQNSNTIYSKIKLIFKNKTYINNKTFKKNKTLPTKYASQ